MKNEGLRDHTRGEMHNPGWNPSGKDEKSKKKVFGGRDSFSVEEKWERMC